MRITFLEPSELDADQAAVYDHAKANEGILTGPFRAFIRVPKLFQAAQDLRRSVAPDPLSLRERQIVHLVVARHWGARYPWHAQVRESFHVGFDRTVIDAINRRVVPELPDARERCCHDVAREMLDGKGLSDAIYARAEATMGLKHLVALVGAVGNFCLISLTANVFQLDPPPDDEIPLAD